jgi:SAM-dependent methyltransferase
VVPYSSQPVETLLLNGEKLDSFLTSRERNLDLKTVQSFGEEWNVFNDFSKQEIQKIGNDYFDLLTIDCSNFVALDVGCGSGRWSLYLSPRVKFLRDLKNIRVTQAGVDHLPFPDNTFDLVYSLGVLHHVPDTPSAIQHCFEKTKHGGYFLLYLYYNHENRGFIFRFIFRCSNLLRKIISLFPFGMKKVTCDLIASLIYWPLAKLSTIVALFSISLASKLPLSYYKKTGFFVMRNDALDRFGTPLEKRFSKSEIDKMLKHVGFVNIQFSPHEPYWHVLAQKP